MFAFNCSLSFTVLYQYVTAVGDCNGSLPHVTLRCHAPRSGAPSNAAVPRTASPSLVRGFHLHDLPSKYAQRILNERILGRVRGVLRRAGFAGARRQFVRLWAHRLGRA